MFTESAELYDAIYFTFKDYAAEAAHIAERIRKEHPNTRSILDVACGTGEHARILSTDFGYAVDGIDLNEEFVRLAREKNPTGHFDVADMTDFRLGRTYDAIICMFSSIAYAKTLEGIERTLGCFGRHLASGGVVIVEPWFPPGQLTTGYRSELKAEVNGVHVLRTATTQVDGRISTLTFEYAVTTASEVKRMTEIHELGLFTTSEMLGAFGNSGFVVEHVAPSDLHRGLYIAHATA